MYDEFRHFAKENLKSKRMTYYKLAKKIGFTESTIELGVKLVYCDKKYIPFFKD